jgi:hypothetical protein
MSKREFGAFGNSKINQVFNSALAEESFVLRSSKSEEVSFVKLVIRNFSEVFQKRQLLSHGH